MQYSLEPLENNRKRNRETMQEMMDVQLVDDIDGSPVTTRKRRTKRTKTSLCLVVTVDSWSTKHPHR